MFKLKRLTWVIGCTYALTGCASFFQDKQALLTGIEIKPVMNIKHSSGNPKIMYLLGRYYQGKAHYQKAIEAYERALIAKPDYTEVHNGLGVIYSMQGQHELALQHFNKAIEISPAETYLYNNLGYAYLIHGKEVEAARTLEQALLLDKGNKRAQHNLAIAYERITLNHDTASISLSSANTLSTEEFSVADISDLEINNEVSESNKIESASLDKISTVTENNLFGFWDTRIEISNGNGVTGMAGQVSDYFQQQGMTKARITNHQTYTQSETEIYYRPGNYQQALQINRMLPKQVNLLESNELRHDIQIKILLGKDYVREIAHFNRNTLIHVGQNSDNSIIGVLN